MSDTSTPAMEGDALTAEQIAARNEQLLATARRVVSQLISRGIARNAETAALRDRLARAEARERGLEYENNKQRDMLAEAISQLGGALTVMPQLLMMRRDWVMTGPERRQPDGAYVWRVHRTILTDGAAPPRHDEGETP